MTTEEYAGWHLNEDVVALAASNDTSHSAFYGTKHRAFPQHSDACKLISNLSRVGHRRICLNVKPDCDHIFWKGGGWESLHVHLPLRVLWANTPLTAMANGLRNVVQEGENAVVQWFIIKENVKLLSSASKNASRHIGIASSLRVSILYKRLIFIIW